MKGILLINLGTPSNTSTAAVRRYLREFLVDPRVIDLPALIRYLLLYLFILPFRPRQSAKAYRKIWTKLGSPLLTHSQSLTTALAKQLGDEYRVVLGMRYGQPTITSALAEMKDCEQIIILPLFPQYSSAATGSAIAAALGSLQRQWNIPNIKIISDFHTHPMFIDASARLIKQQVDLSKIEKLIFSYHGLPERHVTKSGCAPSCDKSTSCPALTAANHFCYRAQCYATTRAIASQLNLPEEQYAVAFQSRLGKTPWIKPYTDYYLEDLAQQGIKHIAIACPSFTADCLETLEEIGMQAREQWESLGGESFTLVSCLNSDRQWVAALAAFVRAQA